MLTPPGVCECVLAFRRLKEIMRIMGLNDSVHWLTWFILCTAVMLTTALLLVLILKVRARDGKKARLT